jgi:hypothetical protein
VISISNLSLSTGLPKPGQAVTATLTVYTDQPDTIEAILHVFGLGSVPITATTGPGQVTIAPESNGNSAAWAVSAATAGALTFTATFTAVAEPYLWTGAVVAAVTGSSSSASQAVGFATGRVVTVNGQQVAQMPTTPAPPVSAAGPIWLTQLQAPVSGAVGADMTILGGPAVQVWGGGSGYTVDSLVVNTGGPQLALVSTNAPYVGLLGGGPINGGLLGPGQVEAVITAGSTGIISATTALVSPASVFPTAPLGVQIGVGVYPPTTSLPGAPGAGTGGGTGAEVGAGLRAFLERDFALLVQLGMVTAADVTDQLLAKGRQRRTPVEMAYRRR